MKINYLIKEAALFSGAASFTLLFNAVMLEESKLNLSLFYSYMQNDQIMIFKE